MPFFLMPVHAFLMTCIDSSSGCTNVVTWKLKWHCLLPLAINVTTLLLYINVMPINEHMVQIHLWNSLLVKILMNILASAHIAQLDPASWCCCMLKCRESSSPSSSAPGLFLLPKHKSQRCGLYPSSVNKWINVLW